MADSNTQVREVARQVALFERAKVVLVWEKRWLRAQKSRWSASRMIARWSSGKQQDALTPFPRWLHVLVPSDTQSGREADGEKQRAGGMGGGGDGAAGGGIDGKEMQAWMSAQLATVSQRMEDALAEATSEYKRALAELASRTPVAAGAGAGGEASSPTACAARAATPAPSATQPA